MLLCMLIFLRNSIVDLKILDCYFEGAYKLASDVTLPDYVKREIDSLPVGSDKSIPERVFTMIHNLDLRVRAHALQYLNYHIHQDSFESQPDQPDDHYNMPQNEKGELFL